MFFQFDSLKGHTVEQVKELAQVFSSLEHVKRELEGIKSSMEAQRLQVLYHF
jgi:hypothetical protein